MSAMVACRRASAKPLAGIAACALSAAIFLFVALRGRIALPVSDMLAWLVAWLDRTPGSAGAARYLWLPHNEHHLVWVRLLAALDAGWLGAHGIAFQAASLVAAIGAAALLFAETARAGLLRAPLGGLGWLVPLLALGPSASLDVAAPINGTYLHALALALLALTLFDGAGEAGPWRTARRLGALAAAMAGLLANSADAALWPALLWSAWRGRAGAAWLAALLAAAVASTLAYLPGLSAQPGEVAGAAGAAVGFALGFLGLPFSADAALLPLGRGIGGLVLAAMLAVLLQASLARRACRLRRIAAAACLFSLGVATLAAIGRSGVSPGGVVPLRYAVLLVPGQAGLTWIALLGLRERPEWRRALPLLAAASGILLVAQQGLIGWRVLRLQQRWNRTAEAFWRGETTDTMVPLIYSDMPSASRLRARLLAAGLPAGRAEKRPPAK